MRLSRRALTRQFERAVKAAQEAGITEASRWHLEIGSKTSGKRVPRGGDHPAGESAAAAADPALLGQGWVHDMDHGMHRMWGTERAVSIKQVEA